MENEKICVAMPAFNEQGRIGEYLAELAAALRRWNPRFIVVNDASTDGTLGELQALVEAGWPLSVVSNARNEGHGPSTISGLKHALGLDCDVVVSLDGDGQADPLSVQEALEFLHQKPWAVAEGVRVGRMDPVYRRLVSSLTRLMVTVRSKVRPLDANTPVRIYSRPILQELLRFLPDKAVTPNLLISTSLRCAKVPIEVVKVNWRTPMDTGQSGRHWGRFQDLVPSRRFLQFCVRATSQWLSLGVSDEEIRSLRDATRMQ